MNGVLLDIIGWIVIAAVVLCGILLSVKARQARAEKQKKKAQRIWQATARYQEAVAEETAEKPVSDVEELEKCFYAEPKQDED